MTDNRAAAAAVLREAARRLGHETSNAANAAAVNVEVLRSRLGAPGADIQSLETFALRAVEALEHVAAATVFTRFLLRTLADATEGADSVRLQMVPDDASAVELVTTGVPPLDAATEEFAARAGITLRSTRRGIILQVLQRESPASGGNE